MLIEKKLEYKNGIAGKHTYMKEMFNIHKHLFEYPLLIKDSPVMKIEITKEQILFHINKGKNNVIISCDEKDIYSIPMLFMNLSETETEENSMILNLIRPGDIIFDIGANIGWYTINILLKHKKVSVYSFEPIPSSFKYLKRNLILNKLNTDKIFNFGLSNENKIVKFFFDVEYAMASSMADLRENEETIAVECEVKKMDDFMSSLTSLKKLDFIKCDVEGAELLVFQGALNTIKKYKPIIFSEMLRKWSKKFKYHPNDIIKFFANIEYGCYIIKNKSLINFDAVDDNTLETNYFFIHNDKKEIIHSLEKI